MIFVFLPLGAITKHNETVRSISHDPSNNTISIATNQSNTDVDIVIVTIPVPQLLNLSGTIADLLEPYKSRLESVRYSSRYALGLFYPSCTAIDVPWVGKYVKGDPCIRYISIDTAKRKTGMLALIIW